MGIGKRTMEGVGGCQGGLRGRAKNCSGGDLGANEELSKGWDLKSGVKSSESGQGRVRGRRGLLSRGREGMRVEDYGEDGRKELTPANSLRAWRFLFFTCFARLPEDTSSKTLRSASSFTGPVSGGLLGGNLGKILIWGADLIPLSFLWCWGLGWGFLPVMQDVTFTPIST